MTLIFSLRVISDNVPKAATSLAQLNTPADVISALSTLFVPNINELEVVVLTVPVPDVKLSLLLVPVIRKSVVPTTSTSPPVTLNLSEPLTETVKPPFKSANPASVAVPMFTRFLELSITVVVAT